MEKIYTPVKMSKLNLDCMFFEIILSKKGDGYRARTSSMSQIANIKLSRPEATSKLSYENAVQKLIPKIEDALSGTTKQLGKIFQDENGKLMCSIENVIYQNQVIPPLASNSLEIISSVVTNVLKNILSSNTLNSYTTPESTVLENIDLSQIIDTSTDNTELYEAVKLQDIIVEWQQKLFKRTKKDYEDDDYFSPTTLESYSRNLRNYVFPYLKEHPEYDDIRIFNEQHIDIIFSNIKCEDTKRVLLISLKLIFDFAKDKGYLHTNTIANKKFKASKKKKKKKNTEKKYDFIEEEQRATWINCMLKEINSEKFKHTDAPLAFLFMLLHGPRPEEVCGVRWIDLDFLENDYHVQNAYKKIPVYDQITMERIGWEHGDGPLKTPESYRHIALDLLIKPLLINHKEEQKAEFKKAGKKWSEKEYVFQNGKGTPFTPDILSKNFSKFIKRNGLMHMVLYGLRHSFATHCRNCGMNPEILALLMGHTEYETTQKYYIHFSPKQKKDELQKVQQQDMQNYYLEKENKDLIHLQNNINNYNKNISNLQEVQEEDMKYYLQLNDETLSILKSFMLKVNEQEKIVA